MSEKDIYVDHIIHNFSAKIQEKMNKFWKGKYREVLKEHKN